MWVERGILNLEAMFELGREKVFYLLRDF